MSRALINYKYSEVYGILGRKRWTCKGVEQVVCLCKLAYHGLLREVQLVEKDECGPELNRLVNYFVREAEPIVRPVGDSWINVVAMAYEVGSKALSKQVGMRRMHHKRKRQPRLIVVDRRKKVVMCKREEDGKCIN